MQTTSTIQITDEKVSETHERLLALGLRDIPVKSPHESWRVVDDGITAVMYQSGKLVLQGKAVAVDKFVGQIGARNSSGEGASDEGFTPHIGGDESGKGDYFGPLVIAACYLDQVTLEKIQPLGIQDSKRIKDSRIIEIYNEIREIVDYEVRIIEPVKYNIEYLQHNNIAIYMSKIYGEVFEALLARLENENKECQLIVVDQFSSRKDRIINGLGPKAKKLELQQYHKAESDIAVATASVIARASFVIALSEMSKEYGIEFPLGAGGISQARDEFISMYSEDDLHRVAKTHFQFKNQ